MVPTMMVMQPGSGSVPATRRKRTRAAASLDSSPRSSGQSLAAGARPAFGDGVASGAQDDDDPQIAERLVQACQWRLWHFFQFAMFPLTS